MPKFRVSMERPCHDFVEVIVEASDENTAKELALTANFDPEWLSWELSDPGEAEVTDVLPADADEPPTPIMGPAVQQEPEGEPSSAAGTASGPCPGCDGKRYLVSTRADGREAVERCDTCSWFGDGDPRTISDEDAAKLAQADGIDCDPNYPCYVRNPPAA